MKILHVYSSPSYSGAEAYALDVANAQSTDSLNTVRFLCRNGSQLAERVPREIRVTEPPKFADFDIIILHSTQELKSQWFRILKAKISGASTKVIVYSHIWISHSKQDPLHAILYRLVDEFWCGSTASKSTLERMLPMPANKIRVIRYGRNIESIQAGFLSKEEARHHFDLPLDAIVIGTMARVDRGKGSVELFEACTDLMQANPNLYFLMIGPPTSSDPKAIELDREIDQSLEKMNPQIRARIRKWGRLENGERYLKAFDLFVLATYKENFALTLLDAMLAERPCLATDAGGSPDVVKPHSTGWLFLPASTESLRNILLQALEATNRSKWVEFGRNGRKLIEANYSFPDVIKSIEERLKALTSKPL